jgi:hypothetical protein
MVRRTQKHTCIIVVFRVFRWFPVVETYGNMWKRMETCGNTNRVPLSCL